MKHKTAELAGARLDQAVAKACGYIYDKNISEDFIVTSLDPTIPPRAPEHVHREVCRVVIDGQERSFCPSSEWVHGGPIIEREGIGVQVRRSFGLQLDPWSGRMGYDNEWPSWGDTPLEAAMRAFVAAKIGAEVDL